MIMAFKLFSLVICLCVFPTAYGCGVISPGRERTLNFTLSNFKIPAVMAYTEKPAERSKVPSISATENESKAFVQNLIMGAVKDVLYQQGRSAFLGDNVISLILQQLEVEISYEPLKCENVIPDLMNGITQNVGTMVNCIIIGNTLVNICMGMAQDNCNDAQKIGMNTKPVPSKHFAISGSIKTSNAIMTSWSNQMWQSVLNRVLRTILSGQNGSFFYGASVNLG